MSFSYNVSRRLRLWVHNWPLKSLGEFRLLPIFFVLGAAIEFAMIHWYVGEVNFYRTYKKNQVERTVQARLRKIRMQQSLKSA